MFTPGNAPFGRIAPQVTPVLVRSQVSSDRTVVGIEVDLAYAVTIVEEEPRQAANRPTENDDEAALDVAMQGMSFDP